MKKIISVFITFCFLSSAINAQNEKISPSQLGISFYLNDFNTASRIRTTSLSSVLRNNQLAKVKDMAPGLALNYSKGLRPHIDVATMLGGSFLQYPMPGKSFSNDNFLLEANAALQLKMLTDNYVVQPFLSVGVGAHKYRSYWGATMPLGVGLNFNLLDDTKIFVTSSYRVPITTETANYHFQHAIGVAGAIGKREAPKVKVVPLPPSDMDKDGIFDSLDKCPTVPGLEKYQGCPIPDTDNDGINDEEDKCPTVAGLARYQGCPIPDTDKDGINDEEDKCIDVPGVARYQGCPVPDTDGDGVNDEEDKCPNLKGTIENKGCPEITEEVKKKVEVAAKNILFETGSAKLRPQSFKKLADVITILNENPDMLLAIDGHTDSQGADDKNQVLSDNRASAVKAYLVGKGVDESRITATGHGETMPIADNKTAKGRQDNRRSELTLSYFK